MQFKLSSPEAKTSLPPPQPHPHSHPSLSSLRHPHEGVVIMRLSSSIAAVAAAHIVAASTTNVYTYDPHWQPSTHGTLSPVEARLVLAQRAGAEDYHEADSLKEGVLEAMNAYGTRRSLFEEAEKRGKRMAFVFLEGADHVQCTQTRHPTTSCVCVEMCGLLTSYHSTSSIPCLRSFSSAFHQVQPRPFHRPRYASPSQPDDASLRC